MADKYFQHHITPIQGEVPPFETYKHMYSEPMIPPEMPPSSRFNIMPDRPSPELFSFPRPQGPIFMNPMQNENMPPGYSDVPAPAAMDDELFDTLVGMRRRDLQKFLRLMVGSGPEGMPEEQADYLNSLVDRPKNDLIETIYKNLWMIAPSKEM